MKKLLKTNKTTNSIIIAFIFAIGLYACNDDKKSESGGVYDPTKPVAITAFSPDNGRIREKIVIKGSNFGNDPSKIEVYFTDDAFDRKATVIGVSNDRIYCLAPRQNVGNNKIKVIVDDSEPAETDETFAYRAVEMVTTLCINVSNGKDEGQLSEINFDYSDGIGYVGDESVIVFDQAKKRTRLISVQENSVINIQAGFQGGKPAVTKDKTMLYAIGKKQPHTIYLYTKDSGWAPSRLSELGVLNNDSEDFIGSLTFAEDEEWLYFCSTKGTFGRFNINTQELDIIKQQLDVPINYGNMKDGYWAEEKISTLVYHPFHKCFYLSITAAYSIYRVEMDGTAQIYAGKSNISASSDGYLDECTFCMPNSMVLDSDGNIYVTDGSRSGGHFIRKITVNTGYVSTVAGKKVNGLPAENSLVDGVIPTEAVFRRLTDICFDGEGGFYVLDGWGRRLRKYAIE